MRCSLDDAEAIDDVKGIIGDYGFAHCYNLTNVTIPASVTSIGDFAFHIQNEEAALVLNDKVTLYLERGSYAEQYTKENNIPHAFTTE